MTTRTIDKKTITIQVGLAAVIVLTVIGGTWKSAIQYERTNSKTCAIDDRLKKVEVKVAALERSGHDVDVKLAEIQKDLKYLVQMVRDRREEK